MPLFIHESEHPDLPEKTPEIAQIIYNALIATGDRTKAFLTCQYPMQWVKQVYALAKDLEQKAMAYVIANPSCTAAQVRDEITNDWLDRTILGDDIVKYNPTYKADRTFGEFKAAVING